MSLRWDMMNSLRNNYELVGMTEVEIIELLGEPSHKSESIKSYYLGYSKYGINTGTLTLRFENGRISKVTVSQG